jgi:hypothetical protein
MELKLFFALSRIRNLDDSDLGSIAVNTAVIAANDLEEARKFAEELNESTWENVSSDGARVNPVSGSGSYLGEPGIVHKYSYRE